jgi:hypothetical protein
MCILSSHQSCSLDFRPLKVMMTDCRCEESNMKNTTILLVEDNPDDEVLTLRALKENNIGSEVDFSQFADSIRELGLYWLVLNETPPNLK